MAAQTEPWISGRALIRLGAELSTSGEGLLRTAGLRFLQGCYEEATKAVNSAAKLGLELSSVELELFDEICRSAVRSLKETRANSENRDEVVNLLNEVMSLIDNCLLPLCPLEDCVIYNLMRGDILSFLADALDSAEYRCSTITAYEEAFKFAVDTCDPLDHVRVRAAISLSTHLDNSGSTLRGYTVVRKAVEDIENALKSTTRSKCLSELRSNLFLLNNLKEQLHMKLSGQKGLLPWPEPVLMTGREEEDKRYKLESTAGEEDEHENRRCCQTKGNEAAGF